MGCCCTMPATPYQTSAPNEKNIFTVWHWLLLWDITTAIWFLDPYAMNIINLLVPISQWNNGMMLVDIVDSLQALTLFYSRQPSWLFYLGSDCHLITLVHISFPTLLPYLLPLPLQLVFQTSYLMSILMALLVKGWQGRYDYWHCSAVKGWYCWTPGSLIRCIYLRASSSSPVCVPKRLQLTSKLFQCWESCKVELCPTS